MNQFFLRSGEIRQNAARAIAALPVDDKRPLVVTVKEMTRNLDQNARFHAICDDVAKQAMWGGRRLSPTQWKVLFISGHAIATGQGADMVPGLENEFVNIRESSASMSVKRMASLIEYTQAWANTNGVRLMDEQRWGIAA